MTDKKNLNEDQKKLAKVAYDVLVDACDKSRADAQAVYDKVIAPYDKLIADAQAVFAASIEADDAIAKTIYKESIDTIKNKGS